MIRYNRMILAVMMMGLLLLTVGCDGKVPQGSSTSSPNVSSGAKPQTPAKPEGPRPAAKVSVKLYYPDDEGEWLVGVPATFEAEGRYKAAVEALTAGTTEKGLIGIFPQGVKVLGVDVKDGLATVNFSRELVDKFVGGSTGEEMLVFSLTNTLTEFPEVQKVQITVEGKHIDTLSGHLDTSVPLRRDEKLIKKK